MAQSLKNIKGFAYDIDGVMTDGSVLAMPDGDILRINHESGLSYTLTRVQVGDGAAEAASE